MPGGARRTGRRGRRRCVQTNRRGGWGLRTVQNSAGSALSWAAVKTGPSLQT